MGFLNSADDVNKLGDLAEDFRDAVMDYQVSPRISPSWFALTFLSDILATRYLR